MTFPGTSKARRLKCLPRGDIVLLNRDSDSVRRSVAPPGITNELGDNFSSHAFADEVGFPYQIVDSDSAAVAQDRPD
jgi:hypothetical protein